MTQISWQYQVNNRAGGYIVTNTDWNDVAGDLRALIDQTTSSTTDNTPLPIGIDLVNDRVYISDPDSTTPEDGNHADTTLSVVGTTTLNGNTQQTGTFTVGVNDTGHDVIFYGATSGAYMKWNQTTDDLQLVGAAGLDIAGDIDVDGTANLDNVDIDGTVNIANTVQIDGAVTIAGYNLTVDTNTLFVDASADRVGIGTLTPYESFDMAQLNNLGVGTELTYGTHANFDNHVGYINFHGYQGGNTQFRDLYFGNGKQGRVMYIDGSSGAVTVDGALSKGSGTFDIAHPIKGGDWRLRHSFIEGPQADLIYRGTVTLSGGTATVDLDTASNMTAGTWEALCRDPWSMAASSGNAVEWSLSGKTLTITSDTTDAVCSWMVIGERQDDHIKADSPIADDDGHLILEYERAEHVYGTPEPPA